MNTHMLHLKPDTTLIDQPSEVSPTRIVEVELGQPLRAISALDDTTGRHYQRALCLIRLHTQPLGMVEVPIEEGGLSADGLAEHIWRSLQAPITEHLHQDGLSPVTSLDRKGLDGTAVPRCLEEYGAFLTRAPFVSIIVATRDRPASIKSCLSSLLALRYPRYEIIIVDNAPMTNATAALIQQNSSTMPPVRYVREDRPGLSQARNCGMMAARGDILVFTDDDVITDSYWLSELVRAFEVTDDIACVTGLILPKELETPAQQWFEEYGGFNKGFTRRIFDREVSRSEMPLHPYTTGQFGSGANMAFTAAFLRGVGGFDPALGAGSSAQGGEELAAFFQVITQGYKLIYQPSAFMYHCHRRDFSGLRKQIYSYGLGLTAYLTKSVLDNPRLLFDLFTRLSYGFFFAVNSRSSKNNKKSASYPQELTRLELKGMLHGPLAYLKGRWATHDARKAMYANKG